MKSLEVERKKWMLYCTIKSKHCLFKAGSNETIVVEGLFFMIIQCCQIVLVHNFSGLFLCINLRDQMDWFQQMPEWQQVQIIIEGRIRFQSRSFKTRRWQLQSNDSTQIKPATIKWRDVKTLFVFVTNSKTMELEELQDTNNMLTEKLNELHAAHQKEVREQSSGQKHAAMNASSSVYIVLYICNIKVFWKGPRVKATKVSKWTKTFTKAS